MFGKINLSAIILLILTLLLGSVTVTVWAEEEYLTNLSESGDLRVIFDFDREKPDVTFISPDGARISEGNSNLQSRSGDKWASYLITNAQAGEWRVDYNPKSNTEVTYDVIESIDNIAIQYFKINQINGNTANVSFKADIPKGGTFNYEISCANEILEEETAGAIYSSSANCGEDVTVDVSMDRISTGSSYRLILYVTMDEETLFDQMYTDSFSYTNPNSPEALGQYKVYFDKKSELVTLDWQETENVNSNEFLLEVKNQDGKIVYVDSVQDVLRENFTYQAGDKILTVSLMQKVGGLWSLPNTKTVNVDSKYSVSILTPEITHDAIGQIECKTDTKAEVFLEMTLDAQDENAEKITQNYTINGNEKINFTLGETHTNISVSMLAPDGIYYVDSMDIYVDKSAPFINLYENYDQISVNSSKIKIVGETASGSVLKINGTEFPVNANGEFNAEISLKYGENKITISSTDKNGNSAERTVVVNRIKNQALDLSGKGIISLVIGLGGTVALIILALILFKGKRKGV